MGISCSCNTNDKMSEFSELNYKTQECTLIGQSATEEGFIVSNTKLHNICQIFANKKRHDRSKSAVSYKKNGKMSESFHISLCRSVHDNSKGEDDLKSIIFEGELLKFRPGLSQDFTPRWCRLTTEGFAYYKNQ